MAKTHAFDTRVADVSLVIARDATPGCLYHRRLEERPMTKARLEAFSDGVFGVAITLLILDVRPEDGVTGWQILAHQWHHILVFVFSFMLVGLYWVAHHHMMHFVTGTDRTLLWLNLLLLLFVVFIPFTAAQLSASHEDPSSIRIYASTLILINLSGTALMTYAKKRRLVTPAFSGSFVRTALCLHTAPMLAYGVAIALASWCPIASLTLMVVVPAFFILPNPWLEKNVRRAMEAMRAHEKKQAGATE
jgi:uncharacterized membrane protein